MPLFDMFDIVKMPFRENPIYELGGKFLKHSACPLPMAMIKAGEVVTGMGLKRSVTVTFEWQRIQPIISSILSVQMTVLGPARYIATRSDSLSSSLVAPASDRLSCMQHQAFVTFR